MADCFESATKLLLSRQLPGAALVHGLPIGTGPLNRGKRYWHAWVERPLDGVNMVFDFSDGKRLGLPADEFYTGGKIELTWKYTLSQAKMMMERYGTYGPWVDGWEKMGM